MTLPSSLRHLLLSLSRPWKQFLAVVVDAVLLLVSFHTAVWARYELFYVNQYYLFLSAVACVGGLGALGLFRVYRYILRYMDERIIMGIAGGALASVLLVTATDTFLRLSMSLSRAVLLMYPVFAVALLLAVRFLARRLLLPAGGGLAVDQVPVLIYGAGEAGSQLAAALHAGPHYQPVALIDDDPSKYKLMMVGLRVYGPAQLPRLIAKHQVRQLLIAMPSASRARIQQIIESVQPYRLRIRLVPSFRELVSQSNGLRLRDIQVEDLLGRDPIPPLPDLLGQCVTDRAVMVTGAGGSIGSELCRQILALRPRRLVLMEISEAALYTIEQELTLLCRSKGAVEIVGLLGSVRDGDLCLKQLRKHGIQTVYHAAAYKHVPIVEHNVCEGILTNAYGTYAIAHAAMEAGVRDFVLISTDKAVRPTNVMGASKRLAELVLKGCAQRPVKTRFSMVRFGNVLGSSGSVVPLFHRQILAGGPITLTHPDITRYFMTIPEAAQLVLQAGAMGESGSVFVLDMGEPVRIRDLAERMVRLYGLTVRTGDFPDGDIAIQIVGLRPGEKLHEELLIEDDAQSTRHPRIMKAQEQALPYASLVESLATLKTHLDAHDQDKAVQLLRCLVPEYAPNNDDA